MCLSLDQRSLTWLEELRNEMWRGVIVEESLEDNRVINGLEIIDVNYLWSPLANF